MTLNDSTDTTAELLLALEQGGTSGLATAVAKKVAAWLREHDLPADSKGDVFYKSWLDENGCNPGGHGAVALVMCIEGFDMTYVLDIELQSEWLDFTESLGFFVENEDHITKLFFVNDDDLAFRLNEQLAFEWHARLVAPDFAAIYDEIFSYFSTNPQRMHDLHHRAFEEMLASVFLAQGYKTILGPGRGDEGVDLRLMENTVYGEEVTVVQAKRYKKAIDLQLVASLSGVVHDQRADRGLFVTTSRYLKSAERFAARQSRRIDLATSKEVAYWCEAISSRKAESEWLKQMTPTYSIDPSKIVVASVGYGIILSRFACVVAETPSAARLARLKSVDIPGDHPTVGHHMPDMSTPLTTAKMIAARRTDSESYWADDRQLYSIWDGRPRQYDHND